MTTPADAFSNAGALALDCSDKLFDISQTLIDRPEGDENERRQAIELIQGSAHEVRRHALWLRERSGS
jgi:hypothetical protein